MNVALPIRKNVIAVMVALTAALFARAWLQLHLQTGGLQKDYASDVSYLIVPPILLFLLAPVIYADRSFLLHLFRRSEISVAIALNAILIGVLLRLAAWSKLIGGVSFGVYRSGDPLAVEGPVFLFQCASAGAVVLGFAVMAGMIPVVEEVAHRAYVQSTFKRYGPVPAILLSAGIFALFHPLSSGIFSFFAGLVFGIQYWQTGSLWPSILSHATVNALIQIDWRCLNTRWNPDAADLPLWTPGMLSVVTGLFAVLGIAWLLKNSGASDRPAAERITER